eukprot:SAG31_NODE_44089_length_264_cov_0.630303_1_plen_67_part_01
MRWGSAELPAAGQTELTDRAVMNFLKKDPAKMNKHHDGQALGMLQSRTTKLRPESLEQSAPDHAASA